MTTEVIHCIEELSSVPSKVTHLESILHSTAKLAKTEILKVLDLVDVTSIADCVVVDAETSLAILSRFCEAVESGELLSRFESMFVKALTSDNEKAIRMTLSQLERVASDCPHQFSDYLNVFIALVELLFAEETGCLQMVMEIVHLIGLHNIELLFGEEVLKIFESVSTEKQLRYFDTIIKIVLKSEACLHKFLSAGIFSRLFKIYARAVSDDPLMLLNCLEIFSSLFTSIIAVDNFQSNGLITTIFRDMKALQDSSFSSILMPAFIKLFTSVGRTNFALLLNEYSDYFDIMDQACENTGDIGTCMVGLESFAFLSQLPESKEYLASKSTNRIEKWLNQLKFFLFKGGSDDIQAKAILIGADLFTVPKDLKPNKSYFDINARWFNIVFDSSFEFLMEWAKSPLAERHVAAQRTLLALAAQPWAQQLMAANRGFVDFLTDRNTESDKMGRETKYEIVKTIFNSKTAAQYFDSPEIVKLGVYTKQGPFYSNAIATVDMEAD